MIDFAKLKSLTIPEGNVVQVEVDGVVIWSASPGMVYVSLGDSIAAGHTINAEWEKKPFNEDLGYYEGTDSQYGATLSMNTSPNSSTVIVKNSYTDLISKDLSSRHGMVISKSFARSGNKVADLIEKLSHENIRNVLSKANAVTICIGANDILQDAMDNLWHYIDTGDMSVIEGLVEANLNILDTDNHSGSYTSLFKELNSINPNAKYVFTTVYNPFKYLWLDPSYNGFFYPLLRYVPDLSIGGYNIGNEIKNTFLNIEVVQMMFNRMNGLDVWVEKYISILNTILDNKIKMYQATNPNFMIADTNSLFDGVPDRAVSAPVHYNDLVNVEFTRGYNYLQLDYGAMYVDYGGAENYWNYLIDKYLVHVNPNNVLDISFKWDWNGLGGEVVNDVYNKVLIPDIDPHPEKDGHEYLGRAFKDVLGLESLDRYTITYNANGGSGSMSERVVTSIHGRTAYVNIDTLGFTHTDAGWYFTGWNTRPDGTGTTYSAGQFIGINSDITLYAQWSNLYTLTYTHSQGDVIQFDSGQTGPMECYELWVAGTANNNAGKPEDKLGAFSNPAKTYTLPYGTAFGVVVRTASGSGRSYIQKGSEKWGSAESVSHDFTLTGNTTVNFEWNQWLSGFTMQSYWNCYITTN